MTVNTAKTSNVNIRKIAMTGVLAAIATVLMFLHFQLPFMPSFISLDFSELPGTDRGVYAWAGERRCRLLCEKPCAAFADHHRRCG